MEKDLEIKTKQIEELQVDIRNLEKRSKTEVGLEKVLELNKQTVDQVVARLDDLEEQIEQSYKENKNPESKT